MRKAWCFGVGLGLFACGGTITRTNEPAPPKPAPPAAHPCARAHALEIPVPVNSARVGGPVVLAKQGSKTLAYVADEDSATLYAVDADSLQELGTTALPGKPSQILLHSDGRVLVAIAGGAEVAVFEPTSDLGKPLEQRCSVATPVR